jgi:two-component system, chemotaxis family, CheB/CheR fusion protein
VVNAEGEIIYVHGRTGAWLEPSPGQANLNIHAMAREGLAQVLTSALRKAAAEGKPVIQRSIRVKTNGGHHLVDLAVTKIVEMEALAGLFMVSFKEPAGATKEAARPAKLAAAGRPDRRRAELERELQYTKESHQYTVEELRSTNEELQSANEELQSTNEELETAKEEMQSLNEELQTVNSELQTKVDDLSQTNNDMRNLLNSTDVATIFLDNDFNIKRFTDRVRTLIPLTTSDVGRPISDLTSSLRYDGLVKDADEVLRTLVRFDTEIQTRDGGWYMMKILPYRTAENVINGVVVTFQDITCLKQTQQELTKRESAERLARLLAENIVDTMHDPLVTLDSGLRVVSVNRAFCKTFEVTPESCYGRMLYDLGDRQWDIPELRRLLEEVLPRNATLDSYEVSHDFPGIGRRTMLLNARRIEGDGIPESLILLVIEDISDSRPGTSGNAKEV